MAVNTGIGVVHSASQLGSIRMNVTAEFSATSLFLWALQYQLSGKKLCWFVTTCRRILNWRSSSTSEWMEGNQIDMADIEKPQELRDLTALLRLIEGWFSNLKASIKKSKLVDQRVPIVNENTPQMIGENRMTILETAFQQVIDEAVVSPLVVQEHYHHCLQHMERAFLLQDMELGA